VNNTEQVTVVDLVVAEERGILCDHCSDPIQIAELTAVLSNGERVHEDGCQPSPGGSETPDNELPLLHVT
jgi:hypothetical protein